MLGLASIIRKRSLTVLGFGWFWAWMSEEIPLLFLCSSRALASPRTFGSAPLAALWWRFRWRLAGGRPVAHDRSERFPDSHTQTRMQTTDLAYSGKSYEVLRYKMIITSICRYSEISSCELFCLSAQKHAGLCRGRPVLLLFHFS